MIRALFDTNVIVDYLALREPYRENADLIFDLITDNHIIGYVNTSSVTDIYYILRKTYSVSDKDCRQKIRGLLELLQAIAVTKDDCYTALDSLISDFEDAVVAVCADKVDIDFIVTRDDEFLKISKTISPSEFLTKIQP